ncbi:MAG: acyltransferase [Pseudolabrys sp.]|nr:acyltransferase [Pseudolabrys sp.]
MKGKVRPVSLARKLVIDLMHVSVPLVVVKRTMRIERLVKARACQAVRPSWTTIIAKAYCIVAREEPWLRTFYLKWPYPHFYELPRSVAMAAIVRDSFDKDVPILLKIGAADKLPVMEVEAILQRGKNAPLDQVPAFRRILRTVRWPLPIRRLIWAYGLNVGRQRANYFGTFAVTSLATLGSETVVANSPGPSLMTYGLVHPDHTMELLLHWDHRIYDGVVAARALQRLEDVMNTEIADELLAGKTTTA